MVTIVLTIDWWSHNTMIDNIGFLKKYENENERITIDLTNRLATDETVLSATSKCYDSNGLDASTLILDGAPTIVGSNVYQHVKGGLAGEEYKIVVTITTSQSRTIEDHILLIISSSTPSITSGVDDLDVYDDEDAARKAISANSAYDVNNNTEMCKRYIVACRRWIALSEDSMTHGAESVSKSANSVQTMLQRAEKWLVAKTGIGSTTRTSGVRFYSTRRMR